MAMTSRAAILLMLLACQLPAARAADSSATERLMRVADCIRDAGDLKGAPREAFMNKCLGSDAALMASSKPKKTAPAAAQVLPAIPVTPVAPPVSEGLPPQERILGCASESRGMQGEARAAYLKDCLAGRIQNAAIDSEQAKRRAACAVQARSQASEEERQAFIVACTNGAGGVSSHAPVAGSKPHDETEARRRAACNVMARDQQGDARKVYIEQCIAAREVSASAVAAPVTMPARSAKERLVRSKACADEARAQALTGTEIMGFMNACMARP